MTIPNLTNSKFKLFQRKSKWFSGLSNTYFLPTNVFLCYSLENFYLSTCHIDLITRYLKWKLKRSGTLVFPSSNTYPITKKPTEVRMGKGKGGIIDWTIPLKKGAVPFFFGGKKTLTIKNALFDLLKKLPLSCKIVDSKHVYAQASSKIFLQKPPLFLVNVCLHKKLF